MEEEKNKIINENKELENKINENKIKIDKINLEQKKDLEEENIKLEDENINLEDQNKKLLDENNELKILSANVDDMTQDINVITEEYSNKLREIELEKEKYYNLKSLTVSDLDGVEINLLELGKRRRELEKKRKLLHLKFNEYDKALHECFHNCDLANDIYHTSLSNSINKFNNSIN